MSEEKLDARLSKGFISTAQAVDQHFGDQQDIDTHGGDSAGRDIHKPTIINIIVPNGDAGSSQNFLEELMPILGQPESAKSVVKAYRSSLPADSRVSRPTANGSEEIVAQLQEFGRLQEFVERLAQDEQLPQSIRDQLEKLIPQQKQSQLVNKRTQQMVQAYLLVVLDPDPGTNRFFANAWLVPDDTVQDPLTRFVPLDLEAEQKGVSCSIEQISSLIGEFLIQGEDYLCDRVDYYNLTVEVFLPRDYLSTGVESWKVLDPVDDTPFSIGTKYSVLVRSHERTQRKYLRLYRRLWRDNWDRVKQNLNSVPSQEMFEQLDRLDDCNERTLTTSLSNKLGLKLTCSPAAKHKEFFSSILKAAVPIAIWSRCSIPDTDLANKIDALLTSGSLLELLERIRQKRWEALGDCEQHLGHHLTILWEDLDRLPPVTELMKPGQ